GQVGQQLVLRAQADRRIERVIAPSRRPLAAHPKLTNPIVDFAHLPAAADWWRADAALCALGTTRKQAGSAENFHRIDHDYVLDAAALARRAGTGVFVYNSSIGARVDAGSFYLRTKGEIERDL